MLKKLRLWWSGRPIPEMTLREDGGFTIRYPTEGVSQRIGKVWRRSKLGAAVAFVAGSITTALVTVTVEHFFH